MHTLFFAKKSIRNVRKRHKTTSFSRLILTTASNARLPSPLFFIPNSCLLSQVIGQRSASEDGGH